MRLTTKLGAIVMAVALLGLTGCGEDEPTATGNPIREAASAATEAAEGVEDATAPEPEPELEVEPAVEAEPTPEPEPEPMTYVVTRVVDGDTVELDNGETVRVVGIDSPEKGECHSVTAATHMRELALGKQVTLGESDEDRDKYGRLLRYVDVGTLDAGLAQIRAGLAIARYDSRDGYGKHPREALYIRADERSENKTCAPPPPPPAPEPAPQEEPEESGGDCMAGYSPCLPIVDDLDCGDIGHPVQVTGSDPYRLDADGDGVGCDS